MRNILSYKPGTRFTGAEIKAWVKEQLENHTSHERQAHYMTRFFNLNNNRLYFISIEDNYIHHSSDGRRLPRVYRAS